MTTSINLWAMIGSYLLAAILSPITVRLLKTLKNKFFIISICILNLILCLQISASAYWNSVSLSALQTTWPPISFDLSSFAPWSYFGAALSLGGGLAIFFISRQDFHKTSVLFLIELAFLETLLFSNHIIITATLTVLSGLLSSIPFCFSHQADKQVNTLTSILLWHRFSDLLLLFSIASWKMNISIDWCASLFLIGIFIRTSPLMLARPLQLNLTAISPVARTFYFFSMGLGGAVLLMKSDLFFLIPQHIRMFFILLYILSAIFAFIRIFLNQNNLLIRADIASLWIALFYTAILADASHIACLFFISACLFFPFLFNWGLHINPTIVKEEPLWKLLILSGWRIDSLIEIIFLKTTWCFAYFTKEIVSVFIYILWIQIPQISFSFVQILLRILNAGGAQKAITVVILGLILFLIHYVGI